MSGGRRYARHMWANWAGDQRCVPVAFERPGTRAEVQAAVERAALAARTVRAAGSGHSFSDAALTDGTLLSLERMDRVLDVDRANGLVRVEAGITLHALNQALLEHGLALPNLGDIDRQAVAGAVATGTHGTGGRLFNISRQVESVELVTGDGSAREVDDGDLLLAARVSTGSLGIITALTLRTVPAFRLKGVDEPLPLQEVLDTLEERVNGHPHFEFWTFPHSQVALTKTNAPTDEPAQPRPAWREQAELVWLDNRAFEALCLIGRRFPSAIPRLNRIAGAAPSKRTRIDHSFRIFASPRLLRFTEMEYAVPREHAVEALAGTKEILERHPVSFPIELRFVAGDEALLSPAHGRDTAYIAVHNYRGMPFERPFREVEAFMGRFHGRPHWGKRSWLTAAELAPRYPRWDAFQAARAELDPEGRFANAYARRMLGPVGSPVPSGTSA